MGNLLKTFFCLGFRRNFSILVIGLLLAFTACGGGGGGDDPTHTHSFGEWVETAATCTTAKVQERTCSCGETETQEFGNPLGHDWDQISGTPATCVATGSGARECKVCKVEETGVFDIDPNGHDWGTWSVTPATCTEDGEETRICSRDANHTQTKHITALDHDWDWTVIAPTCITVQDTGTCKNFPCTATCTRIVVANGPHNFSSGICDVCYSVKMVRLNSAGNDTFTMGSPVSEGGSILEQPQHQVTLTQGFYMGIYQVTQKLYFAVMGVNPSSFSSNPADGEIQDKRPVERVTWYDAVEFCNKLSEREGLTKAYGIKDITRSGNNITFATVTVVDDWNTTGYRLPTEAQWEYACRAGMTTAYNTDWDGTTVATAPGWYFGNSNNMTHEVGKKSANAWGLYDMHGNVFEWCWDLYGSYSSGAQIDPAGESGSTRVMRGGGWGGDATGMRSAYRSNGRPDYRSSDIGFRVLRP